MFCEFCGRPVSEPLFAKLGAERVVACAACGGVLDRSEPPAAVPRSGGRKLGPPTSRMDEGLDIPEDVGARIRRAREQKGLTIEALAQKMAEKASVVQKIEHNRLVPSDEHLEKLERVLGRRFRGME